MIPSPDPGVIRIVVAGLTALAAGTGVRLLVLRRIDDDEVVRSRIESLKTWWGVSVAVAAAALAGRTVAIVLFGLVSLGGYREWTGLAGDPDRCGPRPWEGLLLIAAHYLLLWQDRGAALLVFLPVAAVIWVSVRLAVSDREPAALLSWSARWFWGVLLIGYGLSHAVWFYASIGAENPVAGPAGWFLFLVMLAQLNDIVQALVGRRFGRRPITPRLSPRKTWEGFLGGLVVTAVTAGAVARWLVPLSVPGAVAAGAAIAGLGFAGDLTISAAKREAGVRDSGTALPGQGGVLDRSDSLLVSAPVFFYMAAVLG